MLCVCVCVGGGGGGRGDILSVMIGQWRRASLGLPGLPILGLLPVILDGALQTKELAVQDDQH